MQKTGCEALVCNARYGELLDDFLQFNREREISFLLLAFETDFKSEWVEIVNP